MLSPVLFNIYMAGLQTLQEGMGIEVVTYADNITVLASHKDLQTAKSNITTNLNSLTEWIENNHLLLNTEKTQVALLTPDPKQYSVNLELNAKGTTLGLEKHPRILGVTFDPKMTYSEHVRSTACKAKKNINILKAISGADWVKDTETIVQAYKALIRPVLEYGSSIWGPKTLESGWHKIK